MAIQKWNQPSTPIPIFSNGANLNSLATGASVMDGTGDITNASALDVYASFGVALSCVAAVAPNQINIFLYRLNFDNTTYGDGQFTPATQKPTTTPSPSTYKGSLTTIVGATILVGILDFIQIPPGTFRWVIQSQIGAAVNPTGNSAWYQVYDLKVV
jgi:hypothetical protein